MSLHSQISRSHRGKRIIPNRSLIPCFDLNCTIRVFVTPVTDEILSWGDMVLYFKNNISCTIELEQTNPVWCQCQWFYMVAPFVCRRVCFYSACLRRHSRRIICVVNLPHPAWWVFVCFKQKYISEKNQTGAFPPHISSCFLSRLYWPWRRPSREKHGTSVRIIGFATSVALNISFDKVWYSLLNIPPTSTNFVLCRPNMAVSDLNWSTTHLFAEPTV